MAAAAQRPPSAAAPRKRGPRRPYASGREAQRSIVEAARQVFAERGYRGGSLRDVADRAGVSPANIVHHFGSKEALLIAVLEARDLGTGVSLGERIERGEILEGLRALVQLNQSQRPLVALYATLSAEATDPGHPAHEYFRGRQEFVRRSLVDAIEIARARGNLPAHPSAEHVAAGLIAVMDGLQNQWLLDPEFDMLAAFDAHLELLGASLRLTS